MAINFEERYAYNPEDFKSYGTERVRKEFLIEKVMVDGEINMVYSHIERFITAGAVPTTAPLKLETVDALKAEYFCQRREVGIINIGAAGTISVDGKVYEVGHKEALYIGKGSKEVIFASKDAKNPAKYYINSAPAHKEFPTKLVTKKEANVLHMGSLETSNERDINQMIINGIVETCQLQMGMTELKPGSVWNTMPVHLHARRNEVYFYFEVKPDQAVCHFMGEPTNTRNIWMHNEQAVISPAWSIHSAAGTSNYTFIWGMAGENLDYTDQDWFKATDLL
ncbi:MAG: 5-dehydro-4-deoxy-D-glucuronate isomerase [Mangrovibacterium sp.]